MKEHTDDTTPVDELHGQRDAGNTGDGVKRLAHATNKQCINADNESHTALRKGLRTAIHKVNRKTHSPRKARYSAELKVIFHSLVKQITSGSTQPHCDQLKISLYSRLSSKDVKRHFTDVFGEPENSYDGQVWVFRTPVGQFEVSSNRKNTKFHHIIKLRNLQILPLLEPIIANFPPRGNSSSAAKISSAEIAFDIPLPNLSYEKCERLLQELMLFLVPHRNCHGELSSPPPKKFKDTTDNARNGRLTYYCGKHKEITDKENPKKEKRVHADTSWQGKIYLKAFYDTNGNLGPWHIRLEVNLSDRALKRIGGNFVSFDPDAMQKRINHLKLSHFWHLEAFDWHRFIGEAEAVRAQKMRVACANNDRRAGGKLIAPLQLIRYSGEVDLGDYHGAKIERKELREHFSFCVRRKRRAYEIARRLNDPQFTQQIRKGRFRIPVKLT